MRRRLTRPLPTSAYFGLAKVLSSMTPEAVIEEVKTSGLRGRGGAGFPREPSGKKDGVTLPFPNMSSATATKETRVPSWIVLSWSPIPMPFWKE